MAKEDRSVEEIQAALPAWELWQHLPERVGSYILRRESSVKGLELTLASYEDAAAHRALRLIYSRETSDYVPVKEVGLHSCRADEYFSREPEVFAAGLPAALPKLLASLNGQEAPNCEMRRFALSSWAYTEKLPLKAEGFELFISPRKPLPYINGSHIILDYSDFAAGDQLCVLYNSFRDEFFAEYRKNFVPLAVLPRYDINGPEGSPPIKELKDLEQRLDECLLPALKELARKI